MSRFRGQNFSVDMGVLSLALAANNSATMRAMGDIPSHAMFYFVAGCKFL